MNYSSSSLGTKLLCLFLFLGIVFFFFPNRSNALKKLPAGFKPGTEEGEVVFPPSCEADIRIIANLRANGFKIPGLPVNLEVLNPRYIFDTPYLTGGCNTSIQQFPGPYTWTIEEKPNGSSSTLLDGDSFNPRFTPDKGGDYKIRFTACPTGCEFVYESGQRIIAGPSRFDIVVSVSDEAVIPPATEPIKSTEAPTAKTVFNSSCSGGLVNPQWKTVQHWTGAQDYHLLEGVVQWSHISRMDQETNHYSNDFLLGVKPDTVYTYLMAANANTSERVEVEWEDRSIPEAFRPTRGDRVSVLGYWIRDCGHDPNNTEIHPPVMVATHRARPVAIEGYGTNVIVPGISTDLWVNNDAGEITGNCSQTGLSNIFDPENPPDSPSDLLFTCLPQSKGFSKNPINRTMSFRVYLPPNPRRIYEDNNLPVPPQVPLYFRISNPFNSAGPDPQITPHIAEGYLQVNVNLSNYTGNQYSRKIESAWALPSPSNWGLKTWKVQIPELDVHNDTDGNFPPYIGVDGDWRFWVNINNTGQEWTQLFNCDECVHGRMDFSDNPWSTGISGNRSLGPDISVFPNQKLWFHSSGYDDDLLWSDYTGEVNNLRTQVPQTYRSQSYCSTVSAFDNYSYCGEYTITYRIQEGTPPPTPVLNDAGRAIFDSYKLFRRDVFKATFPEMALRSWNHPMSDWGLPDSAIVTLDNELFFPAQDDEPFTISGVSNEDFAQLLVELQQKQPEVFTTFIKELKEEYDEILASENKGEAYWALEAARAATPEAIWEEHFDYIRFPGDRWIRFLPNWSVVALGILILLLILVYYYRRRAEAV